VPVCSGLVDDFQSMIRAAAQAGSGVMAGIAALDGSVVLDGSVATALAWASVEPVEYLAGLAQVESHSVALCPAVDCSDSPAEPVGSLAGVHFPVDWSADDIQDWSEDDTPVDWGDDIRD
jgi:hypothetical protein